MILGFVSYAYEDAGMCQAMMTHLKVFERTGKVKFWHDRGIGAGEDWKASIFAALDAAQVALFLVSGDMLASDFIWEEELPRACKRAQKGELIIIPVILRPVIWEVIYEGYCLPKLQAVPRNAVPISKFQNPDDGYHDAAKRIMGRIVSRWG